MCLLIAVLKGHGNETNFFVFNTNWLFVGLFHDFYNIFLFQFCIRIFYYKINGFQGFSAKYYF
jgi:hypothetical protein